MDRTNRSAYAFAVERLKRRLHDVHPGIAQQLSHVPAPRSVTVTNQHAMGAP
jgi:hypothetical protein